MVKARSKPAKAQAALAPAGGVGKVKESKASKKRKAAAAAAAAAAPAGAAAARPVTRSQQKQKATKRARPASAAQQLAAKQHGSAAAEPAKRQRLFAAGPPALEQLEAGRTLVCFDSNILMGRRAEAQQAWEAIDAAGGGRVQALVPLKIRLEITNLAKHTNAKSGAAKAAQKLLQSMMQSVRCCRMQREDEVFRPHAKHLQHQRGDDAILDALLHFHSLGAKVLLATQDKFLTQRATEHGLACVGAGQLVAAVQGALAAAPWSPEHDRELALLLFAPGYQQAALGVSFASSHSRESYAAFAKRLQQPLEKVLLAATRLLAGDAATTAAAASCWDGGNVAGGGQAAGRPGARAAAAPRWGQASSSVEQGDRGSGSDAESSGPEAESTGTPELPEGTSSAAAGANSGTEDEAEPTPRQQRAQRRAAAAAAPGLPEAAVLRRLVGCAEYRWQVLGTCKQATKSIAQHFGVSKQEVLQAIAAASQQRAEDKARNKAADAAALKAKQERLRQREAARQAGLKLQPKAKKKKKKGKKGAGVQVGKQRKAY